VFGEENVGDGVEGILGNKHVKNLAVHVFTTTFAGPTCLFLSIPAFDSLQLLSVGTMIHESIFRLCGWCS
jgi:hypothetical protein